MKKHKKMFTDRINMKKIIKFTRKSRIKYD